MLPKPAAEPDRRGGVRRHPGSERRLGRDEPDAEQQVDPELIAWADLVLVMEARHKRLLTRAYGPALREKRIVVLGIPDDYAYMDPELVRLLESRAGGLLRA